MPTIEDIANRHGGLPIHDPEDDEVPIKSTSPDLSMFSISLLAGDVEAEDAVDAARRFREFCLEADQHELMFEVQRRHDGEIKHIHLAPKPALETPRMLVLSTSHITDATNQRLNSKVRDLLAMSERAELPVVFEKGEYGYLLAMIGEDEDRKRWAAIPDLAAIRTIAEGAGCTWVMLDQDGDTVDGLPTYEW